MKKVIFFILTAVCLIIINNLVRSIYLTWQKKAFLAQAEHNLVEEEAHHQYLQQQLRTVSQQTFVEEEARDKLLLVKPSEQLVVIPPTLLLPASPVKNTTETKPYWQEWVDYFSQ